MKNSFLQAVLDKTPFDTHGHSQICFILPSQRAGIEIKKLIPGNDNVAIRLPLTSTLNNWKEEVSGLYTAERSELYLHLYQAYRKSLGSGASGFEKFLSWADVLISDFNDIDNQLLDSKKVFKDLRAYAEIEHFSFLQEVLSPRQENYRKFWVSLANIYNNFTTNLLRNHIGHSGLIGRVASEKISGFLKNSEFYYVIAGFNALSHSEEKILQTIISENRGRVFFDCDPIYLQNKSLKAGQFVRKFHNESFGEILESSESLATKKMDVRIIHCQGALEQARTVVEELKSLNPEERKETAVILPDEDFLVQLQNLFPGDEMEANITMGISLRNSIFYSWLENLISDSISDAQLLKQQPFLNNLRKETEFQGSALSGLVEQKISTLAELQRVIKLLHEYVQLKNNGDLITKQALVGCKIILKLIRQLKLQNTAELSAFRQLILKEIAQNSINVISNPDKNLQIMGLLEARALGFRNIILCSALEEYLPGKLRSESFMPFEIRKHHGLPSNYLKEAAFAYNFYRLTHDAEKLTILFYDKDSTLSAGEKSRYINQIVYDISVENKNISVETITKKSQLPAVDQMITEIEKTPAVLSQILNYLEKGVSASSINRYFEDPVEWYYGNVLKLKEPERDALDVAGFGTLVHDCLDELFKPFTNNLIETGILKKMQSERKRVLEAIFKNKLSDSNLNLNVGEVRISLEIADKMVEKYLKSEIAQIEKSGPKLFLEGEEWIVREIDMNHQGRPIRVKLLGKADKIEQLGQHLYIVDYKTGTVKPADLMIADWSLDELRKKPKSLQLFFYQFMATKKWPDLEVIGQIISLPSPSKRHLISKVKGTDSFDEVSFESVLKEIFSDMLNPENSLRKNPEFKYAVFET